MLIKTSVLCFTLGLLLAQGKTFNGIILDSGKKEPIPSANVQIKDSTLGTSSDDDGKFSIDLENMSEFQLLISVIGYEDTTITISDVKPDSLTEFYLNPTVIEFKELSVHSHRLKDQNIAPSSVSLFGNQFQKSTKNSLASTLAGESGLAVRSFGQATERPILRGYSGDRFLITRDGTELNDLSATSADHAVSTEISSMDGVEVIRGPESLLYGSNTIAGVINLSPLLSNRKKVDKSEYKFIFGHENSNKANVAYIGSIVPIGKYQISTSISSRTADDQASPLGLVENTALSKSDIFTSIGRYNKKGYSLLSLENFQMSYGIPGSPEGHINGVDLKMEKFSQKFEYHSDINLGIFNTVDFEQGYVQYEHREFENNKSYHAVLLSHDIIYFKLNASSETLKLGSLYQRKKFIAGGFYWTPDTYEDRIAIYSSIKTYLFNYEANFSGRIEHRFINPRGGETFFSNLNPAEIYSRNFTLFSGGFSLYKQQENLSNYYQFLITSRAPSIEDLFSDGPHLGNYAYEIGDPNLGQENTFGFENTISWFNASSTLDLTSYINYSPNYHISAKMGDGYVPGADWIEWGSGPIGWLYKYNLIGLEAVIYGLEPSLQFKFKSSKLSLNGSIIRGIDIGNDIPLSYVPPDQLRIQYEKNILFMTNTFEAIIASPQDKLGEFETKTDGYNLFNYFASYTISKNEKMHKIIFQLRNILDQTYYNHLSKIKMIMPEAGRSLNINYRVYF